MCKSRFTEEQMVKVLREADKAPVVDVAKKHGIAEQTLYAWRRRFGGMEVADTKRLKTLEAENTRLKRILAERDRSSARRVPQRRIVSNPPRGSGGD